MKNRTISFFIGISTLFCISLQAQEAGTTRKILLENFTTEKCANCPRGHEAINKALSERDDVIWVAHHSGYLTDPYTTSYGEAYMWFFGEAPFAPGVMIDRTRIVENIPKPYVHNGPVLDVSEKIVATAVNAAAAVPAPIKLGIYGQYDEENRWLQIQVTGELVGDGIPADGDTRLNIYITEDGIKTSAQISSPTPIYIHNHVMRESMTGNWGEKVQLSSYYVSDPFLVKVDKLWKIENLNVVAFISNYDNKDYNNCKVYNAETVRVEELESEIPSGIVATASAKMSVSLSGNTLFVGGGHCTSIHLYDVTGRLVQAGERNVLDISGMASGIYFVEAVVDGKRCTRKILLNN